MRLSLLNYSGLVSVNWLNNSYVKEVHKESCATQFTLRKDWGIYILEKKPWKCRTLTKLWVITHLDSFLICWKSHKRRYWSEHLLPSQRKKVVHTNLTAIFQSLYRTSSRFLPNILKKKIPDTKRCYKLQKVKLNLWFLLGASTCMISDSGLEKLIHWLQMRMLTIGFVS